MLLRLRDRVLEVMPGRPLLMGIVNASPESFSDGGRFSTLDAQVEAALEQVRAGAAMVDVGGESGVTNRAPLQPDEEVRRVVPLVERLAAEGVIVSVDTWKPEVADAVLRAGAALINDVSGLRDPAIADACATHGGGLVVMHTRAAPKRKEFPHYDDVVKDVRVFIEERIAIAVERGVGEDAIVIDPGPDFAKTPAQTIEVLQHIDELAGLGRPVLLAASRKDFVGALTGRRPRARLAGTLAAIGDGVDRGATILRVHDVAEVDDFLRVRAALRGDTAVDPQLTLAEELRREPETSA